MKQNATPQVLEPDVRQFYNLQVRKPEEKMNDNNKICSSEDTISKVKEKERKKETKGK